MGHLEGEEESSAGKGSRRCGGFHSPSEGMSWRLKLPGVVEQ